jgi:hypothetical protein
MTRWSSYFLGADIDQGICPEIEKEVNMSRKLANITRFIGNYRYYRRNGFNSRTAWHLASMTLP